MRRASGRDWVGWAWVISQNPWLRASGRGHRVARLRRPAAAEYAENRATGAVSAAADGPDDLGAVAAVQVYFRPAAARHDVAVQFDGQTLPGQLQAPDQLGQGDSLGDGGIFAVDDNLHHDGQ